jgi:hypothetical protein
MVTFTINIPPMLAYIPAPWILWDIIINHHLSVISTSIPFHGKAPFLIHESISHPNSNLQLLLIFSGINLGDKPLPAMERRGGYGEKLCGL